MAKTSTAKRQRKPSSKLTYDPAAPMPSEAEALEKRADRKALRMADKSGDHKKKKQKKPKPAEGDAPAQVDTASSRRSNGDMKGLRDVRPAAIVSVSSTAPKHAPRMISFPAHTRSEHQGPTARS